MRMSDGSSYSIRSHPTAEMVLSTEARRAGTVVLRQTRIRRIVYQGFLG